MPHHIVMPIVRVAVLATADEGARLTELALPADLPLREVLPAVQRMVLSPDTEPDDMPRLSLAPIGCAPYSLDATLDTVGVVDGDLLALQPIPTGPPAPRIVEDIADAAVIFSSARQRPWGPRQLAIAATAAGAGLMLCATALSATDRLVTGNPLGLYAACGIALVAVLAALLTRSRSPRISTVLSLSALAPVAVAFALAVPGALGPAQVVLGTAGLTAWAIVGLTVTDRAVAAFTAAIVIGSAVLLAAGAAELWNVSAVAIGCGLVLAALLVTVQAAQLSAWWARFPLPVIPAPGDPTPSAQPLGILEDLPRRVGISQSHQIGFIAAGVLLGIGGSVLLVGPSGVSPWAWYLVAAAAAGAVLRARVWDSALCKAWLLAYPYLLTVALLVTFAASGRYAAAWWALAVLGALAAVWVVVATNPGIAQPESYSLPMRRLVGFLAAGIDASLIPVMAYLIGLFTWVINR